jgi:hypothetical protein
MIPRTVFITAHHWFSPQPSAAFLYDILKYCRPIYIHIIQVVSCHRLRQENLISVLFHAVYIPRNLPDQKKLYPLNLEASGSVMVKALLRVPDPMKSMNVFQCYLIILAALGPGVHSASNR